MVYDVKCLITSMKCKDCFTQLTPEEIEAYDNVCEDCFLGME